MKVRDKKLKVLVDVSHADCVKDDCRGRTERDLVGVELNMKRLMFPQFGWNWLDVENWCDGLMDDQGNFIPEYRLFKDIEVSILLYLTDR